MDSTRTDSIAAVEDSETVIAAVHGKRVIENLKPLCPKIQGHEVDSNAKFEQSILNFADAFGKQQ